MLNEFFHRLEFISFDLMEIVSIVLAIFLDYKAKLRQNDSANVVFQICFHFKQFVFGLHLVQLYLPSQLKREHLSS